MTSPARKKGTTRGWPDSSPNEATGADGQLLSRALPHNAEAEQGVLGSMFISPRDVIGECVELLDAESFHFPAHQTIYSLMVELWRAGITFDLITFTGILRDKNLIESVGGAPFITSLWTFVPTAANVRYYIEIVRDKAILRKMIAVGTEAVRRSFEEQDEVHLLLDEMERAMLAVRPTETSRDRAITDDVSDAIEAIEVLYERRGSITGLATGFADLDRMTSGMQPKQLIVIAGRPSFGKTALAMNIAEHVAINLREPVLVFSLEMGREQLLQRMLCSLARINLQKVRDGFLAERDFPALTEAASKISASKLHIVDETLMLDALVARARRYARRKIKLIVVDYLQLISARGFKADHRQQEIAHISKTMKALAKELSIPVILIAQLNREVERRKGGRPKLSDLRESGSIEQDADVVGLLTRDEVYEEDQEAKIMKQGEAELIIAKQRMGPTGAVRLVFLKQFTRFENSARQIAEPEHPELL